ncbi:MAG: flagellin lysine-N-methylase [Bacteroidales bacterium]|nr:flagellin lysine-N-methylase [Clostridium sp.]MCM1204123.1 flagellin lysine-N-methylase [Bacteroidales bacterium]
MKYTTASFYKDFHCIGGICEDSCCENWEIDLDDASLKRYMKQGGEFGKRLKDNTRVKEKQFILNGTRCPFLNEDNLCDIYIEMGEECLCETCTNFPRHIEEFEELKEVSLTMSCPEASRIMLGQKEKIRFICKEGSDEEYGLKHSEQARTFAFWRRGHANKLDKPLFSLLFDVRGLMFEILQNRDEPVAKRAATVLLLGYEIQEFIEHKEYDKIVMKMENYRKPEKKLLLENYFAKHEKRVTEKEEWMRQILNMFDGLETIKEEWKELLEGGMKTMHGRDDVTGILVAAGMLEEKEPGEEADSFLRQYTLAYQEFQHYYQEKEYEFEHILVYYLFNYFLGASYDHDAYTKVKFAVISYLVVKELDIALWLRQQKEFLFEDQVLVAHAYSKEVEHSDNNYESLQLVLSAHPILDVEHILIGLLS